MNISIIIDNVIRSDNYNRNVFSPWLKYIDNQSDGIELISFTDESAGKISPDFAILEKYYKNFRAIELNENAGSQRAVQSVLTSDIHNRMDILLYISENIHSDYIVFANYSCFYSDNYVEAFSDVVKQSSSKPAMIISKTDVVFPQNLDEMSLDTFAADDFYDYKKSTIPITDFYIDNGMYWGSYFLGNKMIRKDLFDKSIKTVSSSLTAYTYETYPMIEDFLLSFSLLINAKKTHLCTKTSAAVCVFNWNEEDMAISEHINDLHNTIVSIDKVNKFIQSNIDKTGIISSDRYNTFFTMFVKRFWHRISWCLPEETKTSTSASIVDLFGISDLKFSKEEEKFQATYADDSESFFNLNRKTLIPNSNKKNDNSKIAIYVSMHKESYVPDNKYLIPIQVGTAISDKRFSSMLHDDEGENISEKNKRYCELTAQYWAWKNDLQSDYYGFFHYRRYFAFNHTLSVDRWGNIPVDSLRDEVLRKLSIDENVMPSYISSYDIIAPIEWTVDEGDGPMTVYQHWQKHFYVEDIQLLIRVINEHYPFLSDSVMNVLFSTQAPFCNLFIMKKEFFFEYSEICFNILEIIEKEKDHRTYNVEQYRTLGHLAERLVAIYLDYVKNNRPDVKLLYLPTVLVKDTTPQGQVHPIKADKEMISLALACDDKYMKYTCVLLQSILENGNTDYFYDIVIMHRDISDESKEVASDIFHGVDNFSLRFVNVRKNFEKYESLHTSRHISLETYYRFMVLDIFQDYSKVLYLDCDMVATDDIANLYLSDIGGYFIGAVRDIDFIASYQNPERKSLYDHEIMPYINLENEEDYFQAGMILFNLDELRRHFKTEDLFEKAMSRSWYYHDQDTLNSLFSGHVKYLDLKWNVFSLLEKNSTREQLIKEYLFAYLNEAYYKARRNPGIIHYGGVPKPWKTTACDLSSYFWKYAKRSPYYESLLNELNEDSLLPGGKIIFTSSNRYEDYVGIPVFEIILIPDAYEECYAEISFIYLSDHDTPSAYATLYIDASSLPNGVSRVNKFFISSPEEEHRHFFDDGLEYKLENGRIVIRARYINRFEGFAWKLNILESRSMNRPGIHILNNGFINRVIYL